MWPPGHTSRSTILGLRLEAAVRSDVQGCPQESVQLPSPPSRSKCSLALPLPSGTPHDTCGTHPGSAAVDQQSQAGRTQSVS